MIWLVIIGVVLLIIWIWKILKIPKCGNMVLITGGIKTGKSTLSVRMAYKTWKKQRLKTRIFNVFVTLFHKVGKRFKNKKPMPLLYSNVPLNVPYVPLTQELLERRERFVYGSVAYFCEASLIADSMAFKDDYVNEQLLLLVKLWAHETKGGYAFYDTQSISDNHYAIKRCLSSYFYIHHTVKVVPFFLFMFVRELKFSEDNTAVNTFNEDIEDGLKLVIVPKSTWKLFDCYCYSVLTDHLPVYETVVDPVLQKDLKARDIVTFKEDTKIFMKGGITRQEAQEAKEFREINRQLELRKKLGVRRNVIVKSKFKK